MIEFKLVDQYPKEQFDDLMDRNLHNMGVFINSREFQRENDFKFEKECHKIKIGAFIGDKLIGLSCGEATSKNQFVMMISLVETEYRKQGVYTKMLNMMLELTKDFDIIRSYHHIHNNQIISLKLKNNFYISGMDQCYFVGPRIILEHYNNEKLLNVMKYRVNLIRENEI